MDVGVVDPVIVVLAAALIGLLAGVGTILSLPKRQPALRLGIAIVAFLLLLSDGMGLS